MTSEANGANGASAEAFWDDLYSASDRIWSGNPNTVLVREAAELTPGTALDLGCGEGADAIWLATRGWRVTATDISPVALGRAAGHAVEAGVGDRVDWQRHDLATSFPAGVFDLVSAHFLHSHLDLPRTRILRAAAAAVAQNGILLVVGHAGHASCDSDPDPEVRFPTPDEVLADLDLPAGQWEVLLRDEHQHGMTGPDGQSATRTNNTLELRRLAS